MKRIIKIFALLFLLIVAKGFAAKVDTLKIYSKAMKKEFKAVVITPKAYKKTGNPFRVVYLLHGYSGNHSDWVKNASNTIAQSDLYNFIIVCPDGGYDSWYFDSPMDSSYRYETFIAKEVVSWTDNNYNTIKDKKARAVAGLSMGGHGALFIAIRHQDVFGAVGSMSGGVDLRPFTNAWDIPKRIGEITTHKENWESMSVVNMIGAIKPASLRIIVDCGVNDFFYNVNKDLHSKLLESKIPHDYMERPGEHNWDYWNSSIKYQMLFFDSVLGK